MNSWKFLSCIFGLVLVSGCVYKMDIQQGNEVTPEQASALELGMSESEVRAILGTPLLLDPFSLVAGIMFINYNKRANWWNNVV